MNECSSVVSWVASPLPGMNGTSTPEAFSIPTFPARTMMSATDAPVSDAIFSKTPSTLDNCSGLLTSQPFCGARRIRAPFAPPRKSEPRNVDALAHAVSIIS